MTPGDRAVGLGKGLEQTGDLRLVHADAGIDNRDNEVTFGEAVNFDLNHPLFGELNGIIDNIGYDLGDRIEIGHYFGIEGGRVY